MATGGELIIDESFLSLLKQMDKQIINMDNSAKKLKNNVVGWLQKIQSSNVSDFTRQLEEMAHQYRFLNETLEGQKGFKQFADNARKAGEQVERVIDILKATSAYKNESAQAADKAYFDWRIEQLTKEARAIRENSQRELSEKRNVHSEMERMYTKLFDEINRKEKQAQNDISNYERSKFEERLNNYRKQRQEQANVDRHYHDLRQKEYDEMFRAIERNEQRQRQINAKYGDSSKGALNYYNRLYSENGGRSIQKMEIALSKLRDAQKRLNLNTEDGRAQYEKLGRAIKRIEGDLNMVSNATENLRKKHESLSASGKQLAKSFALFFSVSQIKSYIGHLVSVRKEFEKQQRSLQALLQNKNEAYKLWQQTIDLAVKSPFRVKELITYTKQLAAYRIETDKLHDTTKMLADVSAGLGVDMNRLILAYGQVRAAEYLRGTELRQFTEAGIPMLEELANHFSILEGRAVSTADVFERISKRMVTFEDVTKVFEKMTSESGAFYRMQEQRSETLDGLISNFHDTVDLMLNDIGAANDGVLKNVVILAKNLAEQWRIVAEVIKMVGFAFAYRQVMLFARGFQVATSHAALANATLKGTALAGARLNTMFKTLFATISANPIMATIGAIGLAVNYGIEYAKSIERANKKYDVLSTKEMESINRLTEIRNEIEKNNEAIRNSTDSEDKRNKAQAENNRLLLELKSINPDIFNGLVAQKDGIVDATKAIEAQNQMLRINIALQQAAKGGWFQQDLGKNYSQAVSQLGKVETKMNNVKVAAIEAQVAIETAFQNKAISAETFEEINKALVEMSKSKSVTELYDANKMLLSAEVSSFSRGEGMFEYLKGVDDGFRSLNNSLVSYRESMRDLYANLDNEMSNFIVGWNTQVENFGEDAAKKWMDESLENLGIVDKEIKELAKEYISKTIGIDVKLQYENKVYTEEDLKEEWQKTIWSIIKDIEKTNPEIRLGITLEKLVDGNKNNVLNNLKTTLKGDYEKLSGDIQASSVIGQVLFTDEQKKKMEDTIPLLEQLGNALGMSLETKTYKREPKDWFSPMASSISDAHKEFIKLNKTLDNTAAKELTLTKYTKVFEEAARNAGLSDISLGQFKFETEQGTVDALNYLKELLPESAKQARLSIENALANITGEMTVSDKVKQDKELIDDIESMFGNYEVSLEMEKLNIPPDLAQRLFGVESIDLSSIRSKIEEEIAKIGKDKGQEDLLKQLQDLLKKVDKLDADALNERMKRYTEFLKKGQTERVKIKLDELRDLAKLEEDYQNNKIGAADYSLAKKGIQDEAEKKLQSLEWDEFKESDTYIRMFEDLDYASKKSIEGIIERLKDMRENLKELSPTEIKEITNAIERLEDAAANKNPFASLVESIKPFVNYLRERKKLEEEYQGSLAQENFLKEQYDKAQDFATQKEHEYELISKSEKATKKEKAEALIAMNMAKGRQLAVQATLEAQKEITSELANQKAEGEKAQSKFMKSMGEVAGYAGQAFSALPEVAANLENVFGSMSDKTKDIVDSISAIGGGLASMAGNIASKNYIGALVDLTKVVGEFFKIGDKRREREIQRELKAVEKLSKEYEKLQKKIEDAFTLYNLQQSGKQSIDNLEKQKDSYEKIIAAEEAKKKSDSDKIDEYKEKLEELEESIEETRKEIFSKATDGILDDVLSTARGFVDAWYDAFKETGDGMKGLEDNFNEMLLNMVKQQAAMTVVSPFIERLKKKLEGYVNENDIDLDTAELTDLVSMAKKEYPVLAENLKKIFEAVKEAGLDTIPETGELSGLQRGIESVSEATAQIIEAYLNAIRMTVVDNGSKMSSVISSLESISNSISNTMVGYLKTVALEATTIRQMFDSIIQTGHPKNGSGIRVFID